MSNAYRAVVQTGGGVTPTGDAVVSDVLSGKTFSNANNVGLTGTMTNNGAVTQTIQPGGSYTIPAGYHNGSGTVSAENSPVTIINQSGYPVAYTGGTNQFGRSMSASDKIVIGDLTFWYNGSNFSFECDRAGTFYSWNPSTQTGDATPVPANTETAITVTYGGTFVYA